MHDHDNLAALDTITGPVSAVPAGVVLSYAGTTPPTGWLLCYGQQVSRTEYATLFSAIGTSHGAGDGSTTFNLPDLRGRAAIGKDDMGGTAAGRLNSYIAGTTLGAAGGEPSHVLNTGEIPSHQHEVYPHAGYAGGNTQGASGGDFATLVNAAITGPTGGGGAHNNLQPSIILNSIIKT